MILFTRSFVLLACACAALAQVPAGSIAGVARDPSGAAVATAQVKLASLSSGFSRAAATSVQGDYSFPALPAGEYEVSVEAPGFQRTVRQAAVEAGTTTTVDFTLRVGEVTESVNVDAATPQMHYDSNAVGGVVTHSQIEDLPLNGRSFLELAKLEPGVKAPSPTVQNRTLLPVLGAPNSNLFGALVAVDGGSITSIGYGGAQMGFSQEVVQEFQVSSVNLDLSTGMAAAGAINVVTRSGGNDLHGTAFYFFRDHKLAAYPALNRDPANADPFFQRRQFGFALGGPIRRDRLFFFGNWERSEQRGVVATTVVSPDFAEFSRITNSPLFGDLVSLRLDGRINSTHTAFIRYSHDGSRGFAPSTVIGGPNAYPSAWIHTTAWTDQSLLGLTSVLRPTLVNDLRFSYFFVSPQILGPNEQDCPGCLGIGAPAIDIGTNAQSGLFIGKSTVNAGLLRKFHLNDSVTWQAGKHRVRFGVDWEHNRGGYLSQADQPATITLFTPDQVRTYNYDAQTPPAMRIPLPASFRTLDDILQLPLQSLTIGIGDSRVLQGNGSFARTWNTPWLYFQDAWRLDRRLTLNYGLGWSTDSLPNYDLRKPPLLAPLLGASGLGPTREPWTNFSPALGLAWAPGSDGKTVVRAGAGLYYGLQGTIEQFDAERAALGPSGLGQHSFQGTSILNPLPGIPDVSVGTPLNFLVAPTMFTGADLMTILPSIRTGLTQSLANADPTVQAIQITKVAGNAGVSPTDLPSPSALHGNLGLQREIARNFVLSVDLAYRHFVHVPMGGGFIDLNHFNSREQVIRTCLPGEINDPLAICSRGQIKVRMAPYRYTYRGLLLRAEKRFSHGFQVLGSYAYSSDTGTNIGSGFNLDNWLQNTGPSPDDYSHILNLAGVTHLPLRFELGLNFSYSSAPPFSAYVGQIDFNGDGTTSDLLPGTTVNAFNRGMGRADLERLVTQFNSTYAGTKDAQGRSIRQLTLPAHYAFGDNFHSLDLRLSRSFVFRERWRLSLIGEVFNLYNKANLSGYSGDLTSVAFGQPTSRATQVFGSGGPRAFQLALRGSF